MKDDMAALFERMREITDDDDDESLCALVNALWMLTQERDMFRDRCLAVAKQCDEMTLRLQTLEARRKKANEA